MSSKTERFLTACACAWIIGVLSLPLAAQSDYLVGPGDVLSIMVYGQPTLSGKFSVEADGTLVFPLIGRVTAGGKTLRAIEQLLTDRLLDGFLKHPEISVSVEQHNSKRIFIMGEIRQPGEYTIKGDTTLIEALARAGSTTTDASGEVIVLRRTDEDASGPVLPQDAHSAVVTRVNIEKLQSGEASQNVLVGDGDTIFVSRGEKVFVYGHVRAPGAYAMHKDMTVLQALSLAGGVSERGAANRVRVERQVKGERKEMDIELGDPIQPGDTLIVPERYF